MSAFTDGLTTFGAILSALIASRTLWELVRGWYVKGWGSRRHWRDKFNHLANWTTDEYMADLLGTPVFINQRTTVDNQSTSPEWIDRTYSTPHAWVVTRSVEGKIQGWSVTITDPKFWWDVEAPTFWQIKSRLGKATIANLVTKPSGSFEVRGARMYIYAESVYFGNPGAYQTYVFLHNNAGIGTCLPSGENYVKTGSFAGNGVVGIAPVGNADLRKATTVNTLMVVSPSINIGGSDSSDWPTVHRDQIRMLFREAKVQRQRYMREARWRRIFAARHWANSLIRLVTTAGDKSKDRPLPAEDHEF
ncbi:ETEC_3214 domain-containing protein [Arthrobacter sp. S2(2024)]|uniref:ETEC_3214 domain-containing protein n=1 Tax=Arthrobacter sp. S2(2024) TaxID=3111911 RepID=UPI002FC8810B